MPILISGRSHSKKMKHLSERNGRIIVAYTRKSSIIIHRNVSFLFSDLFVQEHCMLFTHLDFMTLKMFTYAISSIVLNLSVCTNNFLVELLNGAHFVSLLINNINVLADFTLRLSMHRF